jgi:hypothetical protein
MHYDELYQEFLYNRLKEYNSTAGYFVTPAFNNQYIINGYSLWREINVDIKKPEDINSTVCVGWKFHIGIHPAHLEDIQKAWDVIKNVMISHRIIQTKLFLLETLQIDTSTHSRAVTIYAFKEPNDKNWLPIIRELEDTLSEAGVYPSQGSVTACVFLPSCKYIQYRCDKRPGFSEEAYRNPESESDIYVREDDAVSVATRTGSQPYNPFNLSMPPFLSNLIAQLNTTQADQKKDYSKCSKYYGVP